MTDDEIREIRKRYPYDRKLWAACTDALHASNLADRSKREHAIRRALGGGR